MYRIIIFFGLFGANLDVSAHFAIFLFKATVDHQKFFLLSLTLVSLPRVFLWDFY